MTSEQSWGGEGEDGRIAIAEYVLGVLGGAQREDVARRIQADPQAQAEARAWEVRFSGLNDAFAPVEPPRDTFARIEKRLFPAQKPTPWYERLGFWRGLATASLVVAVAAIGLVFVPLAPQQDSALTQSLVASLEGEQDSALSVITLYDPQTQTLRVSSDGSAPEQGNDYELWAIPPEQDPISLGLLEAGESGSHALAPQIANDIAAGVTFAVSLEPAGGSPTGAPTGPVVASGTASTI